MSLEDGTQALLSRYSEGQEEKNPSRPPPGTVVEAHTRNKGLAFLKRRL